MAFKLNKENRMIAGVCSGLANHFDIDVTLVRILFILGFIFWGVGPIVYLVMWVLMAKE